MKKNLFIIDLYNLIYRMFYAVPQMHTRDGTPVNAIFGVAKFLKSLGTDNPESCILVAADVGKSFRSEVYEEYKGTRERMPDDLRSQIDTILKLFETSGIPVISKEGYEADDIIGSIAQKTIDGILDFQTIIISSDKDLCQFVVDEKVHIYDAMKRKFLKEKDIIDKFGVPKDQIRDYLAIVGDSSDNIPGIAGFGPKKAVSLLSEFGSLENIYQKIGVETYTENMQITDEIKDDESCLKEIKGITKKMRLALLENIHNAFLSQRLAQIITDIDIDLSCPFVGKNLETDEYIALLDSLDFQSLIPEDRQNKKELPKIEVKKIETYDEYIHILDAITSSVSISLDTKNKELGFAVDNTSYNIAIDRVDIGGFLDALHEKGISIIGYDVKKIIHEIQAYKNPAISSSENQESLF